MLYPLRGHVRRQYRRHARGGQLIEEKKVQAAKVVTHILGLKPRAKPRLNCLPSAAAKSWCNREIPVADVTHADSGSSTGGILARHQGIWSGEAEQYLLAQQRQFPMINRVTQLCMSLAGPAATSRPDVRLIAEAAQCARKDKKISAP